MVENYICKSQHAHKFIRGMSAFVLSVLLLMLPTQLYSQFSVRVDLLALDGIEITPRNIFSYSIVNNSGRVQDAEIKGTLIYRGSPMRFSYQFATRLNSGTNNFSGKDASSTSWSFSDNALRELFLLYGKLPQGTYEYCVQVKLHDVATENGMGEPVSECVYFTVDDIFLINLVDPENNAKLYEPNPTLSWAVNHPVASQLTYKLRIAKIKQGQNNINAINRNNPIFQEKGINNLSLVYPITAKPLEKFQPYAWTVDAYYKSILLGGAEPWRFTIVEDTLLKAAASEESYYDFRTHIQDTRLIAVGELKLKYRADGSNDTLKFQLANEKGDELGLPNSVRAVKNGYNWLIIPFHEVVPLQDGGKYILTIANGEDKSFKVPFVYNNPLYRK